MKGDDAGTGNDLLELQSLIAHRLTESGPPNSSDGSTTLDPLELQRSREILVRKRISQTRHLLPKTSEAIGPLFAAHFREFASSHHSNGSNAIIKDAMLFSKWMSVKGDPLQAMAELANSELRPHRSMQFWHNFFQRLMNRKRS